MTDSPPCSSKVDASWYCEQISPYNWPLTINENRKASKRTCCAVSCERSFEQMIQALHRPKS